MEKVIFVCEDSLDGIFTGIYDAWDSRYGHENVKLIIESEETMELFARYVEVVADGEKAEKVARTLKRRLGDEVFEMICQAAASCASEKADALYRVVVKGLSMSNGKKVMDALADPNVCRVFELSRQAGYEAHHLTGFIRFQELKGGILFSRIRPKNNALTLIGPHFADRLPQENWVIYDDGRELFLMHQAGGYWGLMQGQALNEQWLADISEEEDQFRQLWRLFTKSISVQARENRLLQRQNLPLRFRNYMPEFTQEVR
ncbi:TIGR03915 family putative DNA repair protein [Diplocloster modestus]|uniref:TIGR03915 family putative DNA repair protein n=1 Tax=Diplocloster modestus TaxID=2850322 RepID=UPI001EE83B77